MSEERGNASPPAARWRVAVTRDEDPMEGSLGRAMRDEGFEPLPCPVMEERPPADPEPLATAADALERYDWALFASVRAVAAVAAARHRAWPHGLRTAAVGLRTAAALRTAGAHPPPVTAEDAGAEALWALLKDLDSWTGRHVLIPAVPGGRRTLVDGLRGAGAEVTVVEAYRMVPRAPDRIAAEWHGLAPDAAIVTSPSAAYALVGAVGPEALRVLRALVSIGPTTAAALEAHGIRTAVSPRADFVEVARYLSGLRATAGSA